MSKNNKKNNNNNSNIKIELAREITKSNIYSVKNREFDFILGFIKWKDSWKQYCFFPFNSTTFDSDSMRYISDFISKITKERKH